MSEEGSPTSQQHKSPVLGCNIRHQRILRRRSQAGDTFHQSMDTSATVENAPSIRYRKRIDSRCTSPPKPQAITEETSTQQPHLIAHRIASPQAQAIEEGATQPPAAANNRNYRRSNCPSKSHVEQGEPSSSQQRATTRGSEAPQQQTLDGAGVYYGEQSRNSQIRRSRGQCTSELPQVSCTGEEELAPIFHIQNVLDMLQATE